MKKSNNYRHISDAPHVCLKVSLLLPLRLLHLCVRVVLSTSHSVYLPILFLSSSVCLSLSIIPPLLSFSAFR